MRRGAKQAATAVAAGVSRQFTNLATAIGLNPDRAADWIREHRKDSAMVCSRLPRVANWVEGWVESLSKPPLSL
jgi:hypothetical protein